LRVESKSAAGKYNAVNQHGPTSEQRIVFI
jgi:hypothetical protein